MEEGRSLEEAGLRQRFEEEADRPLKGDDLAAKALHKGHQALLAWAAGEAERAWREAPPGLKLLRSLNGLPSEVWEDFWASGLHPHPLPWEGRTAGRDTQGVGKGKRGAHAPP